MQVINLINIIYQRFRNSSKANIGNVNKIEMSEGTVNSNKRNSMAFRQNEFSELKKNI